MIPFVQNDPDAADYNQRLFDLVVERVRYGGYRRPIELDGEEYFFNDNLIIPFRIGLTIKGYGGRVYPIDNGHYGPGGPLGGAVTRITNVTKGKNVILQGVGTKLEGLQFNKMGLIVEGNTDGLATGCHTVRDVCINDTPIGILLHDSKLRKGQWIKDEMHADNCVFENIMICADIGIQSRNIQALVNHYHNINFAAAKMIMFDIIRGGSFNVDGLNIGVVDGTILRTNWFSPNTNRMTFNGIIRDNLPGSLNLFEFNWPGIDRVEDKSVKWSLRFNGHIGNQPGVTYRKYVGPKGLNLDDVKLDITNWDNFAK